MSSITLNYDDCKNMVCSYLNQQKNLTEYCKTHNMNKVEYNIAIQIKNKKDKKPYPKFVLKQLEILGFEVKKEVLYILTPKS